MIHLDLELRGLREAQRDLKHFRQKAIPFAMRDALNSAAFEGRKAWAGKIREEFTTRNAFTAGKALQVEKASGIHVRRMVAVLGSTAEYMAKQEFGGVSRGNGGKRAIPGPVAAGQAPGSKRTKLVRAGSRLGRIQAKRANGTNRRRSNLIAILRAKRAGVKHVLLTRPRGGKGLFLLSGGKRKIQTKLLYNVGRSAYQVPPHPTLGPALKIVESRFVRIQRDAVIKQLKRHRVFGY